MLCANIFMLSEKSFKEALNSLELSENVLDDCRRMLLVELFFVFGFFFLNTGVLAVVAAENVCSDTVGTSPLSTSIIIVSSVRSFTIKDENLNVIT